jgi:hypothetical protein
MHDPGRAGLTVDRLGDSVKWMPLDAERLRDSDGHNTKLLAPMDVIEMHSSSAGDPAANSETGYISNYGQVAPYPPPPQDMYRNEVNR